VSAAPDAAVYDGPRPSRLKTISELLQSLPLPMAPRGADELQMNMTNVIVFPSSIVSLDV
jgi:hypothetical protein